MWVDGEKEKRCGLRTQDLQWYSLGIIRLVWVIEGFLLSETFHVLTVLPACSQSLHAGFILSLMDDAR